MRKMTAFVLCTSILIMLVTACTSTTDALSETRSLSAFATERPPFTVATRVPDATRTAGPTFTPAPTNTADPRPVATQTAWAESVATILATRNATATPLPISTASADQASGDSSTPDPTRTVIPVVTRARDINGFLLDGRTSASSSSSSSSTSSSDDSSEASSEDESTIEINSCVCSSDLYSCSDGYIATACFSVCGSATDIHELDTDNDGIACEGDQ